MGSECVPCYRVNHDFRHLPDYSANGLDCCNAVKHQNFPLPFVTFVTAIRGEGTTWKSHRYTVQIIKRVTLKLNDIKAGDLLKVSLITHNNGISLLESLSSD